MIIIIIFFYNSSLFEKGRLLEILVGEFRCVSVSLHIVVSVSGFLPVDEGAT
jgi:hypothetical protein